MKVGDIIYCINNHSNDCVLKSRLTINKAYKIIDIYYSIDFKTFTIVNDKGYNHTFNFDTTFFINQTDYREIKLNKLFYENK